MIRNLLILLFFAWQSAGVYAEKYFLTLYAIPSRKQIDFSTPRRMARTAFANALTLNFDQRKNAMGHVFIELEGDGESIMAGTTKKKIFSSGRKELIEGYGLGILFRGISGRLHFEDGVKRDLPTQYHFGNIAFIQAQISKENYERLRYYLKEYQLRGYDTIYNGLNRPREGLGAGCTAFGVSFFEVAGILQPGWLEEWTVHVRVPYGLIGGPLTGNTVPLNEVFVAKEWAAPDEPHIIFSIIDPFLIYEWIHLQWNSLSDVNHSTQVSDPVSDGVKPVKRNRALGLFYDFSKFPVPEEPVFFGRPEADSN